MHVRRQILHEFFKVIDLAVVTFAVFFAYGQTRVAQGTTFAQVVVDIGRSDRLVGGVFLLILWHLTFERLGLYGSRRPVAWAHEAFEVFKAATMGSVLVVASGVAVSFGATSSIDLRQFAGIFWLTATSLTMLSRLSIRAALEHARRQGHNLRQVLVVGTNERALEFARKLEERPEMGYRVVGFADQEWPGLEEFHGSGGQLICGLGDELERYLLAMENIVDEVVVALPFATAYHEISRVVSLCEELGITVRFVSQIFDLRLAKAEIEIFEGEPILTLESGAAKSGPMFLKRLIDLGISLAVLIVLSPVLVLAGLAIWATAGRPILLRQRRLGFGKRPFWLYSLRTTVPGAKEGSRLVPLGPALRRTRFDQLPELWNVLAGDMSLVGPRPMSARAYERCEHRFLRRFRRAPGITCLWQVKGGSAIPHESGMMLDLEYIDEWSLWLDFQILVKTIPVILFGDGDGAGVEEIPHPREH